MFGQVLTCRKGHLLQWQDFDLGWSLELRSQLARGSALLCYLGNKFLSQPRAPGVLGKRSHDCEDSFTSERPETWEERGWNHSAEGEWVSCRLASHSRNARLLLHLWIPVMLASS